MNPETNQNENARALVMMLMRTFSKGVLEDEAGVRATKYVFAARLERLVLPAPKPKALRPDQQIDPATGQGADRHATLHIPDESVGAVHLHIQLFALADPGEMEFADRWQVYHGRPGEAHWYSAKVLGAKVRGVVVDGPEVILYNPLADDEPRLLRRINAVRGKLPRLFAEVTGMGGVSEATAVGLDPMGIDLRTRVGVARLPMPELAMDVAAAELALTRLGL
jgi:hypothetical protein